MTDTTQEQSELTFEAGYARLQQIAARLAAQDVPVTEMCDLFAEGKGLQHALAAYLDTQRARVEAIEQGEGIPAFRIGVEATAPSDRPPARRTPLR
ncbi:MAG TPA: exodeoxyribonuclease VII small subunit [Solirubrobacteraceae bacterium]|nr:exodeoxyribonuclease VII small subunit [Solirubrobacteraceae bacterium]